MNCLLDTCTWASSHAQPLFQALTVVDDGNRHIRRPTRLSRLVAITGAPLSLSVPVTIAVFPSTVIFAPMRFIS